MAPTFQLSNITLSSINNSLPVPFFGLQDALNTKFDSPYVETKYLSLFPDACDQNEAQKNCTTSCQDPQQIFARLDTLHNCVVWPSVYVQDENSSLLPFAAKLAGSLGLTKGRDSSSLPSIISTKVQNCLLDACDSNDECARNANRSFPLLGFRATFSADLTGGLYYGMNKSLTYFDPCNHISAPATADVAGIGVFISYAMQMGLVLVAFVLAIPYRNIAHGIFGFLSATWHRTVRRKGSLDESKRLKDTESSGRGLREEVTSRTLTFDPASAILPAVVEFQKAQCYFMLATNIAGLVVQTVGGLELQSLQQLYNTFIFIKVIAIGGYLPITFGLLILRMLKKLSWYVLALSIASVGVAIGNLYKRQDFRPNPDDLSYLRQQSTQGGPSSCGNNNLLAWCYSRIGVESYNFRATNGADGADNILKFSLVVLGLLIIEHFWQSSDRTNRKIRDYLFRSCISRSDSSRFPGSNRIFRWLSRLTVPIIIVVFVAMYLYFFAVFAVDLDWFRENKIYDPEWSFGQIVALMVWAPPIFEYFWESFRGIEGGSDHRLPNGYEVIKVNAE